MSNANNVSTGKPKIGGAAFRAPLSSTLPTDATTALGSAFKGLGYISEEGLINSNSPESSQIKAWGGDIVGTAQTGRPDTFKAKFIEMLNPEVLKAAYGDDNVTETNNNLRSVRAGAAELDASSWVFEMILRGGILKRVVLPNAKLTALGDISYTDNGAVGYELTLTAYPDTAGFTHYEYFSAAQGGGT